MNIRILQVIKYSLWLKLSVYIVIGIFFYIFVTFFFGDPGAVSVLLQSLVRVYLPIPYDISAGNWGSTWKYLSFPARASYISVLLQSEEHVRGSLDPRKRKENYTKNKRRIKE